VFSSIKIDYKQLKVQMDKVRRMKEQWSIWMLKM
jgi:hypothetical protein